jgi:hypothetical protein
MLQPANQSMKALLHILIVLLLLSIGASAQQGDKVISIKTDSTTSTKTPALTKDTLQRVIGKDTVKIVPKHSPRIATIRSAILPGLGQAYNREYWKIPIVYGVIGVPAGFFIYNNTWYKRTKRAYEIRVSNDTVNPVFPKLEPLSVESLRFYRNSFRRDRDYAVLYFFIAWALNVVDATVFGHLKDFDVSPDLSLKIKPAINPSPAASFTGLSLVLAVKSSSKSQLSSVR